MPSASPVAITPKSLSTEQIIDELGPLDEEIDLAEAKLKPKKERAKFLASQLLGRCLSPVTTTLEGHNYTAMLSQPNKVTGVRYGEIWKLPKATLKEFMSAGIEKLRKVLNPTQQAKILFESQTGPRKVTTYRKLKEAA
jgi:hypothetical protein